MFAEWWSTCLMRLLGYSICEGQMSITIPVPIILVFSFRYHLSLLLVFLAYAVVTEDKTLLFIDEAQVDDGIRSHLADVEIRPYDAIFTYLQPLASELELGGKKVGLSAYQYHLNCSWSLPLASAHKHERQLRYCKRNRLCQLIISSMHNVWHRRQDNVTIAQSPVAEAKAIKNEAEISGFRESHLRDGVALVRYFAWLEEQLNNGVRLSESDAATKLEEYRSYVFFIIAYFYSSNCVPQWACSLQGPFFPNY